MTETNMEKFAQSLIGKSPYEIYKEIRNFDKENGKGSAMAALKQSQEFSDYCKSQLRAFLDNRLALSQRDAENIDKWWIFSSNDFSLNDIQRADAKAQKGAYIRSERFVDMDKNPAFLKFVNNIPYIQEEMEVSTTEATDNERRKRRQIVVDFARFMECGKHSRQNIDEGKWDLLIKEFDRFPTMPIKFITKLYEGIHDYNQNNPKKQQYEREAFSVRILSYRLNNICNNRWNPNLEEIEFLKTYLINLTDSKFEADSLIGETLKKLEVLQQKIENTKSTKQDEDVSKLDNQEEENSKTLTPVDKARTEAPAPKPKRMVFNFVEEDEEPKLALEKSEQKESEQKESAPQEPESKEEQPTSEKNEEEGPTLEESSQSEKDLPAKDSPAQNLATASIVSNEKSAPVEDAPAQKEDKASSRTPETLSWKNNTLSSWQEWGKQKNKVIQEYKSNSKDALSFKVYDNAEKAQNGEFDADITYRKENDVVIKGYKGKVPSDEVFAALVAQAKKEGAEICFGDIKNNVFKAKLLLACLNDKDIKMVNPPKMSELTDLPEDLKAKLESYRPKPTSHAKKRLDEVKKQNNKEPSKNSTKKTAAPTQKTGVQTKPKAKDLEI